MDLVLGANCVSLADAHGDMVVLRLIPSYHFEILGIPITLLRQALLHLVRHSSSLTARVVDDSL